MFSSYHKEYPDHYFQMQIKRCQSLSSRKHGQFLAQSLGSLNTLYSNSCFQTKWQGEGEKPGRFIPHLGIQPQSQQTKERIEGRKARTIQESFQNAPRKMSFHPHLGNQRSFQEEGIKDYLLICTDEIKYQYT